jgi:hypothetical protein
MQAFRSPLVDVQRLVWPEPCVGTKKCRGAPEQRSDGIRHENQAKRDTPRYAGQPLNTPNQYRSWSGEDDGIGEEVQYERPKVEVELLRASQEGLEEWERHAVGNSPAVWRPFERHELDEQRRPPEADNCDQNPFPAS